MTVLLNKRFETPRRISDLSTTYTPAQCSNYFLLKTSTLKSIENIFISSPIQFKHYLTLNPFRNALHLTIINLQHLAHVVVRIRAYLSKLALPRRS